jgi:hypothetical protein
MPQDSQPEKETVNSEQKTGGQTAEERPNFEVKERETESLAERDLASPDRKPTIPDSTKPQIPQGENIPTGGPGDQQAQAQTIIQSQTDEEKVKKTKKEFEKPIRLGTPQERKDSGEIEDKHNDQVLNQP